MESAVAWAIDMNRRSAVSSTPWVNGRSAAVAAGGMGHAVADECQGLPGGACRRHVRAAQQLPAVVQRDRRPAAGMRACGQRLFLVLLAGAGWWLTHPAWRSRRLRA